LRAGLHLSGRGAAKLSLIGTVPAMRIAAHTAYFLRSQASSNQIALKADQFRMFAGTNGFELHSIEEF
jgi:hypothetical protein